MTQVFHEQASLHEQALAKVNLYLHVTARRPDGYHLLDSLAVFPGAADRITARPANNLSLTIEGPHATGLDAGSSNLVLRAAQALASAADHPPAAALTLEKHLPIASGIGGGSADAAATLRVLSRLWNVTLPAATLATLAQSLGADVPVCLHARPTRMQGIGEHLSPAPGLPAYAMLLVNPGTPVSTPEVFRARTAPFTPEAHLPSAWPDAAAMAKHLATLANDLELPAMALCPAIAEALAWLRAQPGCLLARMSGSGATCFALFPPTAPAAVLAATAPTPWWSWGGMCPPDGAWSRTPAAPHVAPTT